MNLTDLPIKLSKKEKSEDLNYLLNLKIPDISLPTQDDNLLKLSRFDTFRLVLFCYPMTGNPNKSLPQNWENIPGASGCTIQNCSFRDNYDNLIKENALPIGISTQSIEDIKEMTTRLKIPYDVLSDQDRLFSSKISLPTFSIGNSLYLNRLTLIIENSFVKKYFYPIFSPDKHIFEVLDWLKKN